MDLDNREKGFFYREEVRDLFSVPDDYYLAHCISADFGMGKGIVVEFNKRFNLKNTLISNYPDFLERYDENIHFQKKNGCCIKEGRILNLITKRNYWNKPTYQTIRASLKSMKDICISKDIKKVAMPLIGCGLDRLEWDKVSEIIKSVFSDTDIEILVCKR